MTVSVTEKTSRASRRFRDGMVDVAFENHYRLASTAPMENIMLILRTSALITASLLLSAPAFADDRPDHFKGEASATLGEAMSHFAEYNRKLAALLAKGELAPQDMHEIHVLTYTLENALEKIDDSVDTLKDTLEDVHKGSEHADPEKVKKQGKAYLQLSEELKR